MKILVTGCFGIVGKRLVEILRGRNHLVFGIDVFHSVGEAGFEHKMDTAVATYSRCDIADYRQLIRIFESYGPFDLVYNTAAEFGRWNGEDYYEQLWRTNVIGTKNILRIQEKYKFRLVHFSSSEVYGDYDGIMSENVMDNVEIKQMNDYAMTKWVNEMQIRNSTKQYRTETVIVRLFNTYGPGELYHPYRSVNAKFCYNILHGIRCVVYKGHSRTSLYMDDACNAVANIAEKFISGAVYNIGGTEYHTIEKLALMVCKSVGCGAELISYEKEEIMTTINKRIDVYAAQVDLGLKNSVSLEQGVENTVKWMREYYHV